MGWTIGVLGFDSRRGLGIFLFTTATRTALVLTQPPIQWVPGALSLGVKRPRREADHSPPSSAEVKEWVELYIHSSNTPSRRDAQLKHRDNFTLTFTFHNIAIKEKVITMSIRDYLHFYDFLFPPMSFRIVLQLFYLPSWPYSLMVLQPPLHISYLSYKRTYILVTFVLLPQVYLLSFVPFIIVTI
jgi:hypothetical protein